MLRLFDYSDSGNGYKVRLLLHQLEEPFELIEVDILRGETRTEDFLRMNPNGRVPLLALEDGRYLAESDAILFYLGEGTPYLPDDRLERAHVLQWMFFEQYNHEPNIATSRFWLRHFGPPDELRKALLEQKHSAGHAALGVMEAHLRARQYFVGERYTIADIALYAYTHVADQGGFSLKTYPAIQAWLKCVREQPRHLPMSG